VCKLLQPNYSKLLKFFILSNFSTMTRLQENDTRERTSHFKAHTHFRLLSFAEHWPLTAHSECHFMHTISVFTFSPQYNAFILPSNQRNQLLLRQCTSSHPSLHFFPLSFHLFTLSQELLRPAFVSWLNI